MPNPTGISSGMVSQLVDGFHATWPLWQYVFLAQSPPSKALITGYFITGDGYPIQKANGIGYTYAATVDGTPITLLTLFGLIGLPANAIGFIGTLAGTTFYCTGSQDGLTVPASIAAEMKAKPGQYPAFTATNNFRLGRA